jgi:hypothetical protein
MRELVEKAARYVQVDPDVALAQLRRAAEKLTAQVAENNRISFGREVPLFDRLTELETADCMPGTIVDRLHRIRMLGNEATHQGRGTRAEAFEAIDSVLAALKWYEEEFPYRKSIQFEAFDQRIRILAGRITTDGAEGEILVDSPAERPIREPHKNERVGSELQRDWLSDARSKTNSFLDTAEKGIRAAADWAKPRASRVTTVVREKAGGALRNVGRVLDEFAKKHGQ